MAWSFLREPRHVTPNNQWFSRHQNEPFPVHEEWDGHYYVVGRPPSPTIPTFLPHLLALRFGPAPV